MKNFVDFIVDAAKDSGLADEFEKHVYNSNHSEISSWLKDKGYDVHEDECKKIADNKDHYNKDKLGFFY